jgi:hypothetical protein
MDEKFIEQAEMNVQRELEAQIAKIKRTPSLQAIGYCHNCSEALEGAKLFCDTDCNKDWEYRNQINARLGSP